MNATTRRLVATWIVGAIVGTAVIAITSPLFVRSYAPLHTDGMRGTWTLPEGLNYRWRSEGYADTQIGPFGMPGKTSVPQPVKGITRVALWGDSQAEGVCVSDHQKLFAQAQRISAGRLEVFPLARSGEDAADWLTQMPAVEQQLAIDLHVLLVVDLPDLVAAIDAPVPPPGESEVAQANAALAARLPAFVIQAARYLLTESDGTTHRKLRFSIGPVRADEPLSGRAPGNHITDWFGPTQAIGRASDKPIVILYAPKSPQIIGGKVVWQDPSSADFAAMRTAAEMIGLRVVDTRDQLRQSALQGSWPHGFQNGVIGSGHLNQQGYRVVAAKWVSQIDESEFVERKTTLSGQGN